MTRKDIPNIISLFRVLLVIPIVMLLYTELFLEALILFFIAGFSDALDGFLAKRYDWGTRLGSILDPIADKVLLVSTFVVLAVLGLLPFWLLMVVIARDVVIIIGAVAYYLVIGHYMLSPSIISKLNTVLQISLVLIIIVSHAIYVLPDIVLTLWIYATLFTTILSGLDYVTVWGRKALSEVGNLKAHD